MKAVKFFPDESNQKLFDAAKKAGRDYLSGKVIKRHSKGLVDIVVSVPESANELVESVSSKADASPRFEEVN